MSTQIFSKMYFQTNTSSKNAVTYGHELVGLVALEDLSDIYAYNSLINLYKQNIQWEEN